MAQNDIKAILDVWSFLLVLPWQQCTNFKFAIRFEKSSVPQTQFFVSDLNTS